MNKLFFLIILLSLVSCKKEKEVEQRNFSEVEIEVLLQDSLLNVRAIESYKGDFGFATSNGEIGGKNYAWLDEGEMEEVAIRTYQFRHDSLIPNFRSLEITDEAGFVISISTPALLYKISDSLKLVYKESHPKAFYDSMDFWNDQEGIAIGDPTEECMSIIITRDGGDSWSKLSCDILPKVIEGEAAFAASDTNIAIVGDHTWVATGGKASRVLYSPNKGETWQVYDTPIIQGGETTGIYSIDFYDENNGFAIGGDYLKPENNQTNKIRTTDGGKTWKLVGAGEAPGYRSCVQYIPNSNAQELVAIGFNGIDYSNDSGESWKHLSNEGFYTIRFLNDSTAYAAGKGRIAKLSFK